MRFIMQPWPSHNNSRERTPVTRATGAVCQTQPYFRRRCRSALEYMAAPLMPITRPATDER
jgi:hypothetical protein